MEPWVPTGIVVRRAKNVMSDEVTVTLMTNVWVSLFAAKKTAKKITLAKEANGKKILIVVQVIFRNFPSRGIFIDIF